VGEGVGVGRPGVGVGELLNATDPPPQPHMPSKTIVAIKNAAHDFNIAHLSDGTRSDATEFLSDVPGKARLSTWI
jgi:hypothetical protein